MPWCPICKDEYREGITTCADCGCELVDDLSLVSEESDKSEGEYEEAFEEDQIDPELLMFALSKEDIAKLAMEAEEEVPYKKPEVYVNNEEKAEDNKSSAYTLLGVGVLGLAAIIMFLFGIIPSTLSKGSKYMISGVMGTLFVLFFIMGIVSLRNFRTFKKKAYKENNLTAQIKEWCIESFDKDSVDGKLQLEQLSDEVKYFPRVQFLKESISKQFMNLDDAYLERLVDEVYSDIFEG